MSYQLFHVHFGDIVTHGEFRSSRSYISGMLDSLISLHLCKLLFQFPHFSLQLPHVSLCVFIDNRLKKGKELLFKHINNPKLLPLGLLH